MYSHMKELYRYRSVPELVASRALSSFAIAMAAAAWAVLFLNIGLNDAGISRLKAVSSILVFVASLLLPRFLEKFDEAKTYPLTLAATGLVFIGVSNLKNVYFVALFFVFVQILYTIKTSTFSILFRDSFSKFYVYETAQGIVSSINCFSWFIGPLLAGFIMQDFSVEKVIFFAGIFFLLSGTSASFKIKKHRTKRIVSSMKPIENLKNFSKIRGLKAAYLIRSGIDAWWTLIFIFVPVIMVQSGYSVFQIGLFVGLSQLPLVLVEFLSVRFLDRASFKLIFSLCYLFLLITSLASFIFSFNNIILLILILSSLALAFLEPITEIYFFELTKKSEEETAYPVYATSSIFGEGAYSILVWPIVSFLGVKYSFLAISMYMFMLFFVSRRVIR